MLTVDEILISKAVACVVLFAAFNFGMKRKSTLITSCCGLMLVLAGLVLLSDIMIDGFYRRLRTRRRPNNQILQKSVENSTRFSHGTGA